MKQIIERFIQYLRYERNVSPDTIREYRRDMQQFEAFLTPPGEKAPPLSEIDHRIVREYVASMYDRKLSGLRWRGGWLRCERSSNSACARN